MSALIAADHPSIVASAAAGALPMPFPQTVPDTVFHIDFPDFGFHMTAPITDFHFARESGKVTVQANINSDVIFKLSLSGKLISDFRIDEVWIDIRALEERPRAEFIASTLFALLGLSEYVHLRIPEIGLNLSQRFDMPLKRISQRLQMRQADYRLMIIERATGIEFFLPQSYSGEEIKTITYLYHAIVDRSFLWPIDTVIVPVLATKDRSTQLPSNNAPQRWELGPTPVVKNLFGQQIDLGGQELFVEDAIIENFETARNELACNDGHLVEVVIRSLSGTGKVVFKNAPQLPDSPWDSNLQTLIDLESRLDALHSQRYHALAASTLEGLSEEEKKEISTRPQLDEEAFDDPDFSRENI